MNYNHEVRHPCVFYQITNVECVYWSNTTTFTARTDATYYFTLGILYFSVITQHT